jgi:hypothetical protein
LPSLPFVCCADNPTYPPLHVTKTILIVTSDQQLAVKDQQLAEKDQHLRQQLAMKDQQIQKLYEDNESWREQVRYKVLQVAQLQDRMIPLPSPDEPQPRQQEGEQSEPAAAQEVSGNVLSRFWHWFIGK